MKLLHVIAGLDPRQGGVGQAVRTIIAGLAERGIHSEVASGDAPDAAWTLADPFVTHALGPARGPWGYTARLGPWLRANLGRFDAVILHGLWLYQGYALRQALRSLASSQEADSKNISRLPQLLVMPHGMLDPYFQRAEGRRLKAWRNWLYWRLLEGAVVNDAAGVLFTCETERLLAHEPFAPYRPRRELVVGLGVAPPPPYTPAMRAAFRAACPTLSDRPYLLFLSRLHEKKGADLLLRAYARLAQTAAPAQAARAGLPAPPALPALVLAGPGLDTPYGQQLRQLSTELPAGAAVYFPGMLTGEAKWGAFYGCEAFVLPSHQENFGIAVVEALACHKPVLISDQVNIWREIAAAGGGLVAPPTLAGTEQLLARWQQLSIADRHAYGEHAHRAYCQHFAVGPAAEKMAAALAQCLVPQPPQSV